MAGANVNVRDADDWTPTVRAAHDGHFQILEVLISAGKCYAILSWKLDYFLVFGICDDSANCFLFLRNLSTSDSLKMSTVSL